MGNEVETSEEDADKTAVESVKDNEEVGENERKKFEEDETANQFPEDYTKTKTDKTATVVHPLDGLDKDGIIQTVDELQKQLRHLRTENMVFENFLRINDPETVEMLEQNASQLQRRLSASSRRSSVTFKLPFRGSKQFEGSPQPESAELRVSSLQHLLETPKISLLQRTELVLKELEDVQAKLDDKNKEWHDIKFVLVSKIEELETRKAELEASLSSFEEFRQQDREQLTFPKFIRFMEEWSKRSRLMVDKLRLRYSSLKVQYQKTSATLAHKKLIGENLQEIDFEQLRIENLHLVEKIENQALLLLELKRITAAGNLQLSQQKKTLLHKMEVKEKLMKEIGRKEKEIAKSDNETVKLGHELDKVKEEHDQMKDRVGQYEAPEVMEYIQKKAELENLKRELKMWSRRMHIKHMALKVATKQLVGLVGGRHPDPNWFE